MAGRPALYALAADVRGGEKHHAPVFDGGHRLAQGAYSLPQALFRPPADPDLLRVDIDTVSVRLRDGRVNGQDNAALCRIGLQVAPQFELAFQVFGQELGFPENLLVPGGIYDIDLPACPERVAILVGNLLPVGYVAIVGYLYIRMA